MRTEDLMKTSCRNDEKLDKLNAKEIWNVSRFLKKMKNNYTGFFLQGNYTDNIGFYLLS